MALRETRPFARLAAGAALALAGLLVPAGTASAADQKLLAADGGPSADFGAAVAVDGDTAVVGAPNANLGRGAVYVFKRTGNTWAQTAKLTASDSAIDDRLGSSVAIDGDMIVAGAKLDDVGAGSDHGSVYTFARTGAAARTQTAKLTASDGAAGDHLGVSVAIDGDTIVAGATSTDVGSVTSPGYAYTFARTGGNRTQTAKLTASDGAADDRFGASVAIDGDTIVVGASQDNVAANADQGSAYTFASTGGNRTQTAKLAAGDGAEADVLGTSVAIDGDTIVAGAPAENPGTSGDQGAAYTFARTGADRSQTAKLTASDAGGGDGLGVSVAIDEDAIVAGASTDDIGSNSNQGSAYTFPRSGGDRQQTAKLTAADGAAFDNYGNAVAADGDAVVVGSFQDDVGLNGGQGSATVFFTAVAVADSDGDGVPDSSDVCPSQPAATANGCPAANPPGSGGGNQPGPGGGGNGPGTGGATPAKKVCEGLRGRRLANCRTDQKVRSRCGRLKGKKKTVCAKRIRALARCDRISAKTRKGKAKKKACVKKAKAIGKKKKAKG